MAFLTPDRYFSRIVHIDIARDILQKGFTHVLLDVDNTILTRDDHRVPLDVLQWLDRLKHAGVDICLLSNNFHEGVRHLAERLELPIVAKAIKPLPHGFLIARNKIGGKRKDTLMIGDQLITDVLGAHFLAMTAYMVCPLVEEDLKHTLLLRNVERIFMRESEPEGAATCETSSL